MAIQKLKKIMPANLVNEEVIYEKLFEDPILKLNKNSQFYEENKDYLISIKSFSNYNLYKIKEKYLEDRKTKTSDIIITNYKIILVEEISFPKYIEYYNNNINKLYEFKTVEKFNENDIGHKYAYLQECLRGNMKNSYYQEKELDFENNYLDNLNYRYLKTNMPERKTCKLNPQYLGKLKTIVNFKNYHSNNTMIYYSNQSAFELFQNLLIIFSSDKVIHIITDFNISYYPGLSILINNSLFYILEATHTIYVQTFLKIINCDNIPTIDTSTPNYIVIN